MGFKELEINNRYISKGDNNIASSLIVPALKYAKLYCRSVAFFSSSVFKMLKPALNDFINNNGEIRLVVCPVLDANDIEVIKQGYNDKGAVLADRFIDNFSGELKKFDDYDLSVLYDLIVNNILNIKVANLKSKFGIYHDKLGILIDKNNEKIVFYGSANESYNAYVNNYEIIRVISTVNGDNNKSIEDEIDEFNKIWNNTNEFIKVLTIKDAILEKIIKEKEARKSNSETIVLRDYQKEAIKKWVDNGYRGFYEMATGTGKTWTAIYSAKELLKFDNPVYVIVAPYKHLINQWRNDLEKVFKGYKIINVYSDNSNWRTEARNAMLLKSLEDNQIILLATIKSFNGKDFQKILDIDDSNKMLIVDEAHRFTNRDEEIKQKFKYLLGLSATPSTGKIYDNKNELINYFGDVVFKLPIEKALQKGFLVKYKYHPVYVHTTSDEEEKFKQLAQKIAGLFDKNGMVRNRDKLKDYLRMRLRIISMAKEKEEKVIEVLSNFKNEKNFIVYCGDGKVSLYDEELRHLNYIKKCLDSISIKASQFTASEDAKTRMNLIDNFNNQNIDVLVAIKCLDEGVDIPSIKKALIVSSNDNYREFVQRRGRILRKYPGKECADIYDMIVLPSTETKEIAKIEFRRFYEYARLAINYESELKKELEDKLSEYDLTYEDIKFIDVEELEDELDE